MIFVRKGQQPLKCCYYLDSLGGVGEVYGIHAVVCHSRLQELCTVPESEPVPMGQTGDFWHQKAFIYSVSGLNVNLFSVTFLHLTS